MPTTQPRIMVTMTKDLEAILDVEYRLHPDLSLSTLVALLIRRGHEAGDRDRRHLVEALGGGEDYPPYRAGLRREWPT